MNERGLATVLKGIYAFVMKRIDALSGRVEKAQNSAENANSAAETAQTAADAAQQSANNANTNANSKVSSVNKKTGVVTLTATDVGAMAARNPTGTGTLAMNRKTGSTWGDYSSILGKDCTASGTASHAEGSETVSSMKGSHSEGVNTTASGLASHAEGSYTTASGGHAHAEGWETTASGDNAHAEGNCTTAAGKDQHAQGRWNIEDAEGKHAHIVGNGSSDSARSNAHTLDWSGNSWYAGKVTAQGYEVEADGASHALAASDVGAISDTDGSVQNAHLADSSVTTDKLAEGERMTGANVINAIGGYDLIDTITAEGGESQITVTSVNGLTDVLLAIVSPSTVTASTAQAYVYFDGDTNKWSYVWLNDAAKSDGTSTLSVSITNGYVDILAIPSMVRNQSGGSLRGQRRVRDVQAISSISYVMPSGSTFDAGTIIQVYGRR